MVIKHSTTYICYFFAGWPNISEENLFSILRNPNGLGVKVNVDLNNNVQIRQQEAKCIHGNNLIYVLCRQGHRQQREEEKLGS